MKTTPCVTLMIVLLSLSVQTHSQDSFDVNNAQTEIWGEISVRRQNRKVEIKWNTLFEFPGANYFVQHSTNGKEWNVIGRILQDDANNGSYHFSHHNPQRGVNYYRLQQAVDKGNQEFSKVISLHWFITRDTLLIQPNPSFTGNVQVDSPKSGTLRVFDSAGFFVKQTEIIKGSNAFDFSDLQKGLYYIRIDNETTSLLIDVVKENVVVAKNNSKNE